MYVTRVCISRDICAFIRLCTFHVSLVESNLDSSNRPRPATLVKKIQEALDTEATAETTTEGEGDGQWVGC